MIYLNKNTKQPLYLQIYNQIKTDILLHVLKEGTILTGSRTLAQTLHISRNTVDTAYSQLATEGYIIAQKGVGYIITALPKLSITTSAQPFLVKKKPLPATYKAQDIKYDLTNGSHTNDLFPKTLWRRTTIKCLDILDQQARLSSHLDKQGEIYLRENLLAYLRRIRGVKCQPEQIIITCGLQQSLDIICKLLHDKRPSVLMEEPGYHKAAAVFKNNNLKIKTIPIDKYGINVNKFPQDISSCLIYSTPSHQFPTGITMPIHRRLELLTWAKTNTSYILEDDFDSELRYYAKQIPSLQSIDENNNVIYLGTFSKGLSPSLRMGYIILPPQLLEIYMDKFQNYNSTVPILNQYVVAYLLENGEYDRHIRRLNSIFRKRLELFNKEFSIFNDKIKIIGNNSGQYFLLEFAADVQQAELIIAAKKQSVQVYPTMQFWQDRADCPDNTLFLGFSKISLKDIPDCVHRLKKAWSKFL